MKKITTIILLNFIISLKAFSFGHADMVELDTDTDPEDLMMMTMSNVSSDDDLKVDVQFRNFTDSDKTKVFKAVEILEKVMNSNEFKQRVQNFTFQGETRFHQNNGMSNEQIYQHLMTGEEDLIPGVDRTMNFDLTLYRSKNPWSKVKGYTKPDTIRIWMNKKFFRKTSWTAIDVAGNMAHEWVHKMGFGHDYRHNADRPYSVPYAIGYIVGDVARSMGF
jgi:hypothetical protein